MKTKHRFMGLFGCLACLGMGGSATADTSDYGSVILDNLSPSPVATHPPEKFVNLTMQKTAYRNGMLFVPPRPDINYKIGKAAPEPGIDYKIHIVGPKLRSPLTRLGNRLEETIRKNVPRK